MLQKRVARSERREEPHKTRREFSLGMPKTVVIEWRTFKVHARQYRYEFPTLTLLED
jgi:hypothetical protein